MEIMVLEEKEDHIITNEQDREEKEGIWIMTEAILVELATEIEVKNEKKFKDKNNANIKDGDNKEIFKYHNNSTKEINKKVIAIKIKIKIKTFQIVPYLFENGNPFKGKKKVYLCLNNVLIWYNIIF